MKNIFKSFLALAAGVALFASCQQEQDPMAADVSASQTEISLAGDSYDSKTINVTSDGDWIIVNSAEWLTVEPTAGSGNQTVTLKVKELNVDSYNELNGPRSEKVYLFGKEGEVAITVNQYGESGLDASRTYSKITSAKDIEAGKGYLIVANDGTALQAAKGFAATSDTYYSYIYTDKVEESSKGVIVRSNANNGFVLADAGDGLYYLQMPNGRYLYQNASYNNFYSTTDKTVANKWSVTFNEDGTVKLNNEAVSKYFQYSTSYTSYGAYGSAQDNAALPYLYKDAAAPSDEVLSIATSTTVNSSDTSVSIPVTANKTWKVRNHDSWIKSFTKEGKGDGAIVVTFDENTSETDARTATFQIIGETTNFEITLTQDKYYPITDATIGEVLAAQDGDKKYRVSGIVTGMANSTYGNYYIQDAYGKIYVYGTLDLNGKTKNFASLGVEEGDIITVVGQKTTYNGTVQFKNAQYESHKDVKAATAAEVNAMADDDKNDPQNYVLVKGTVTNGTSISGHKFDLSTYGNFDLVDASGDLYVYGVTTGWNGPTKQFGTLGVKEGDTITLIGYKTSYKGTNELVGVYISHETPETPAAAFKNPAKLDNASIKAAHTAAWTYTSGAKTITAADGSAWVAYNTYAAKDQVTLQMNKAKSCYILTPEMQSDITKLTVEVNYYSDGTSDKEVTRTFDILDGDTTVASNIKGSVLLSGYTITGSHKQLKIAPNETNGGACYILSITVE